ncbi:hypothetical protein ACFYZ9_19810 [Streptomyces sp. NPDC001691]|uniref:hypothetical protein n=1 Tax=Streptomyces sp. NPDC001691 TaxID=3364600 RepID=UPI0036AAF680
MELEDVVNRTSSRICSVSAAEPIEWSQGHCAWRWNLMDTRESAAADGRRDPPGRGITVILNLPQMVFEAALKLMRLQGLTAKQAITKAKSTIPGAAAIDTKDLEKKLEAEAFKPMAITPGAYMIENVHYGAPMAYGGRDPNAPEGTEDAAAAFRDEAREGGPVTSGVTNTQMGERSIWWSIEEHTQEKTYLIRLAAESDFCLSDKAGEAWAMNDRPAWTFTAAGEGSGHYFIRPSGQPGRYLYSKVAMMPRVMVGTSDRALHWRLTKHY